MENASTKLTSLLSGVSPPYEDLASTGSAMSYLKQVASYAPWALVVLVMLVVYGLFNIKTMPMMWTVRTAHVPT